VEDDILLLLELRKKKTPKTQAPSKVFGWHKKKSNLEIGTTVLDGGGRSLTIGLKKKRVGRISNQEKGGKGLGCA